MLLQTRTRRPANQRLILVILAMALLPVLFARSMFLKLDHDEHQFVASAVLVARGHLVPYRDFPYFHTPYQMYCFAALFGFTDHLLLAARALCATGGWATAVVLLLSVDRLFANRAIVFRHWMLAATAVLFLFNPLFCTTSGRSWNHDLPIFFTLLAYLAMGKHQNAPREAAWSFVAGICGGIAVGLRLTFAPAVGAFVLMALLRPDRTLRQRLAAFCCLAIGTLIGLGPLIGFFLAYPRQTWFGNFVYPALNTRLRATANYIHGTDLVGRGLFIVKNILRHPGNPAVYFLVGCAIWVWRRNSGVDRVTRFRFVGLISVIAMLFVGAFAPNPLYTPYFYAPIPFMVLLIMQAVAMTPIDSQLLARWKMCLIVAVVVTVPEGLYYFAPAMRGPLISRWVTNRIHDEGVHYAAAVSRGRVLTFAPIMPLEGGCTIYPELATGPFAYRVAPFVPQAEQARYHLLDEATLPERIADRPPTSILLSGELEVDEGIKAYGDSRGVPVYSWQKASDTAVDRLSPISTKP